jgi:magnesium-transporting ATPase (P-type)
VKNLFGEVSNSYLKTALFATFMMSITMNGFNARTKSLNLLKEIHKNWNFLIVMGGIFIGQYLFITFGGKLFGVEPLSWSTWGICLLLAFLVIPLDLIRKLIVICIKKG